MSRELRVTEARAVALLLHPRIRRVLGEFLEADQTVARAAKRLGLDVRVVHRDVLALTGVELLRERGEQRRAGRPIKIYRAIAPALFVPMSATTASDFSELGGRSIARYDKLFDQAAQKTFERLLHEQGGGREWGIRLFRSAEGEVIADQCYEGSDPLDAGECWQRPSGLLLDIRADVRLTESEARAVQMELIRLIGQLRTQSLGHKQKQTGRTYLLRLGLVEVEENSTTDYH